MKKQIRYNTFETNSSNVNTLTIMTKDEYEDYMEKWKSEEWMWDSWHDAWVFASARDFNCKDRYYDNPICDWGYDVETENYTTKHGDEIVAVSIYGHD